MPDIKVKDVAKGTVKAIDKSATAAQRMKNAYIRTKEKVNGTGFTFLYTGNAAPAVFRIFHHGFFVFHDDQGSRTYFTAFSAANTFFLINSYAHMCPPLQCREKSS